jgi:hypothetical protein
MPNLNMKAEAYEILYKFYVIFITVTEGASSYEVKNFNEAKTLVAFTDSSKSVIIAGCLNTESVLTKGSITPQFPRFLCSFCGPLFVLFWTLYCIFFFDFQLVQCILTNLFCPCSWLVPELRTRYPLTNT